MMTKEGYYIRPDGTQVHPSKLTNVDIKNMSLSDYAVCRTYLSFGMPRDDISPLIPTHRDIIELNASEIGSGPARKENYNPFDREPEYTKPVRNTSDQKYAIDRRNGYTAEEKKQAAISVKPKTYEDYYWEYVDATDAVKAAEAFHSMLEKVRVDQEPKQSSSWVLERVPETPAKPVKKSTWSRPLSNKEAIFWIFIGIQPEIWLSLLHLVWGWAI